MSISFGKTFVRLLVAGVLIATLFRVYVIRSYHEVFTPSPPYVFGDSIELADIFFYGDSETTNMVLWTDISHREVEAFYLFFQGVAGPIGNLDVDITGISIHLPTNDTLDIPVSLLTKKVTNEWYSLARGRDFSDVTAEEIGKAGTRIGSIEDGYYSLKLEEGERGGIQFHVQLPAGQRIRLNAGTLIRIHVTVEGDFEYPRNDVLEFTVERVERRIVVKHWFVRHVESF